MSWVNAWALAGVAAIALPILIHLMGRAPARVRRFPSLRFLDASRLLPSKRSKLQDPLLLLVRAAILILAALALAGPVFNQPASTSVDDGSAIVAIVDTSASVSVRANLVDVQARVAPARTSAIVETGSLRVALAGAAAWLRTQPGLHEVVIYSDFTIGSLDSAVLSTLPAGTGVAFVRLAGPAPATDLAFNTSQAGAKIVGRATRTGDALDVTWRRSGNDDPLRFDVLGTPAERSAAELAQRAGRSVGMRASTLRPPRNFRVVYPGFPGRAELIREASAIGAVGDSRFFEAFLVRLAADPLLAAAASEFRLPSDTTAGAATTVLRSGAGAPFLSIGLTEGVVTFVAHFPADAPASAALFAAIGRAFARDLNASESESRVLSDADLSHLATNRSSSTAQPSARPEPTESKSTRWLWVAALLLLAIEWALRARIARTRVPEAVNGQPSTVSGQP
jgi:hypothetical protein